MERADWLAEVLNEGGSPSRIRGCHSPSENRNLPEMVKVEVAKWVAFRGRGAVTALLDDHGQSQGNCGVWSKL